VGRNMAKHLLRHTMDTVIIVDDLSVGIPPHSWLGIEDLTGSSSPNRVQNDIEWWGEDERLIFWK